jgi:hypothetical protein
VALLKRPRHHTRSNEAADVSHVRHEVRANRVCAQGREKQTV